MDEYEENMSNVVKIEKTEVQNVWKIKNYRKTCHNVFKNGEHTRSCLFSSGKDDLRWYLRLYPAGASDECKDFVSMYLVLDNLDKDLKVTVHGTISLVSKWNLEVEIKEFCYIYDEKSTQCGWDRFINNHDVQDGDHGLLPNGELIIICRIEYSLCNKVVTDNEEIEVMSSQDQFSIYNQLGLLLKNKSLTDVVLVASNKEFHVHKTILAARSPVFLAMFERDLKETQKNKVEILDFNSNCVGDMVHYMYTGKVNNFDENPTDLLRISDKYDIKGLRMMCEDLLYKQLTLSNVIKYLILADTWNSSFLKKKIIEFILVHRNDIKKCSEFEAMKKSHPHLGIEILSAIF